MTRSARVATATSPGPVSSRAEPSGCVPSKFPFISQHETAPCSRHNRHRERCFLARTCASHEFATDKWPYINLFPDYADNLQLGTTGYADYLQSFITTCHPRIISYDNYSLMDDGSIRSSYWTNLEAVRNACKRHKIEF